MLRNIDPILSPKLLHTLCAMGHGDEIIISDANFPAESSGPRCIRGDGSNATDMLRAVLSLMPLDSYVSNSAHTPSPKRGSGLRFQHATAKGASISNNHGCWLPLPFY
ncbi:MAG: hypothetical protein JKY94_08155 [Rhodobacteraceae bacterium]|nr:hypothetical protein [Paracoccaceae bacterium]